MARHAARKDVLAVSEQAKALDAPRCLELFAAYALGRVALGEGSLPEDDARSVREALCAAVSKQIYRGDLNLHEPPPVPQNDCFPPQPLECAPPLIFEKVLEDCDLGKEGFVDRMRGAILEMEASLADTEAPAPAVGGPAPAPGVPRIAEVED